MAITASTCLPEKYSSATSKTASIITVAIIVFMCVALREFVNKAYTQTTEAAQRSRWNVAPGATELDSAAEQLHLEATRYKIGAIFKRGKRQPIFPRCRFCHSGRKPDIQSSAGRFPTSKVISADR
jgi:hypothetical protein